MRCGRNDGEPNVARAATRTMPPVCDSVTKIPSTNASIGRPRALSGESVKARRVVPEDRALHIVGQRELEKARDGARILAIRMWEVGGEHDVERAHQLDDARDRIFIALDRDEALALEVPARLHRQLARVDVAEPLVVLVHPPKEERRPARIAFEERHAQAPVPVEDSTS